MAKNIAKDQDNTEEVAADEQQESALEAAHKNLEDEGREPDNSETTEDTADFDPIEHGKQTAATNLADRSQE